MRRGVAVDSVFVPMNSIFCSAIRGAGIATVVAGAFSLLMFFALLCSRSNNDTFHTIKGWRLERDLFVRLLRYGFPSGVQFFLEMAGFTAFVLLVAPNLPIQTCCVPRLLTR